MKKIIIIVILAAIGGAVWFNIVKDRSNTLTVRVEYVKRGRIEHTVSASGKIQPITEVKISAEVTARIEEITVQEGDSVKAGQLLVQLDPTQLKEALEQNKASLQSIKFQLKKAKSEFNRTSRLYEKKLVSDAEWESVQAKYELQFANMKQTESSVRKAKDEFSKTQIISPIDGVVINLAKEEGEVVVGGMFQTTEILRVANLAQMEVVVDVDETDVVDVELSDSVKIEIDAFHDRTFIGKVTEISHSANITGMGTQEQVTTFQVIITMLDSDILIRPGMSATVDIQTDVMENTISVPIQSVTVREKKDKKVGEESGIPQGKILEEQREMEEVVFVFADGIAKRRLVELGISSNTRFEIVNGLQENDQLIVGPFNTVNRELKDGTVVEKEDFLKRKHRRGDGKWNNKRRNGK